MDNVNEKEHKSVLFSRMAEERQRLGLTQQDLATWLEVTRNMVGRYERGEAEPGCSKLARMAELGADVQYIICGIHSRNPPPPSANAPCCTICEPGDPALVKGSMELVLKVVDDLGLDVSPSSEQFRSLLGFVFHYQPGEAGLVEYIKSAYAMAGRPLPIKGGEQ